MKRKAESDVLFPLFDQAGCMHTEVVTGCCDRPWRPAEKLAIVVERGFHSSRHAHSLLEFGSHFMWEDCFLHGSTAQHPPYLVGIVAQEHVFGKPGKLEEEHIPAFTQLPQCPHFTLKSQGMRSIHDD